MKDRKMAEYYLIGTLVSITFALLAGIVIRAICGRGMKKIFLLRRAFWQGYSKRLMKVESIGKGLQGEETKSCERIDTYKGELK